MSIQLSLMMEQFSIKCKTIVTSAGIVNKSYMNINKDKIYSFSDEPIYSNIVDHSNDIVLPGFIDIHTHGYFGVDASTASPEEILYWAKMLAKNGVTSFIPTCVSLPLNQFFKFIDNVKYAMQHQSPGDARILGARSEGPFINLSRKGAHNPEYIRDINIDEINNIINYSRGVLRIIDMAPEIKNFNDAMSLFSGNGIIVSMGHTDSDYITANNALISGVRLITHFYNAMTQFDHRNPGVVGAGLLSKNAYLEIISDFHHVSREAIEIMINNVDYNHVIEITDSLSIGGTENQEAKLGGLNIIIRDGVAWIKDTNTIAGSILEMKQAYKNLKNIGISSNNISKLLSNNQAQLLGLNTGNISPGKTADLCFMDDSGNITDAMVSGVSADNSNHL